MRNVENLKKEKISNKTFIIFVFIAIALVVLIFILNSAKISDWILFFTFWALVWYAWETKRIREIEEKPIVDLYYRPKQQNLKLRNTGKGTAYNIEVQEVETEHKIFWFYFDDPNLILTYNDEQFLYVNTKYKQNKQGGFCKQKDLGAFINSIKQKSFNEKNKLAKQQKQVIIISYKNAMEKRFKRFFYIYSRNMSGVDEFYKKDIEVEFYQEEIL